MMLKNLLFVNFPEYMDPATINTVRSTNSQFSN